MKMDDETLGRMLLDRGVLLPEEYEDAEAARRATGRPLAEILVEKAYLSAVQLKDALAALEKRVKFCNRCNIPVYVARVTAEGEKCPRCLEPVQWHEEKVAAKIQDLQNIVQLAKDELPPEVEAIRTLPGRLFGKYILVSELGKGGAGVVQKAWDTMLGEYVALKFIREQSDLPQATAAGRKLRQEQIQDLLLEARAALRLRHAHIVGMRDIGKIDDQFFIAMDFIDGQTLVQHFRAAQARNRLSPLYEDPSFYLRSMRDVANAIHYAHTFPKPIVHCDLKPGNVIIGRNGIAYVMDFGLARALGDPRGGAEGEEKIRGTPAYMAPEQVAGKPNEIGVWTDIYALGAILYELLAGRAPFVGETFEVLFQATRDTPQRPTEVLRRTQEAHRHDSTRILDRITKLEHICLKCLAKQPKDRYASAREVAEELEAVIEAIEAGQDKGIVPPSVQEAQVRSEIKEIDRRMTHMEVEAALQEYERLKQKREGTKVRNRLADRRQQLLLVEQMGRRLVEKINAARPTLPRLELHGETVENVEILKATPKRLFLLVGDDTRDVEWATVRPAQVIALAEAMELDGPEDRLAMGIICHHAKLVEQAVKYLTSLKGTTYEEAAQHILESTA